ncbi:RICIN domain-containing protein [Microbispora sp. CA-135349]|uniref:RICIN domain-containing protein n=1 Tax=Microbispora sp. CA-135349 TaxID=3239953 RepID=UPI003D933C71
MALTLTGRTLAMAACLLTGSLTLAPPATAAGGDGAGRLKAKFVANLVARHSDKCLDVYGRDTSDGARVVQWTCGNEWPNQEFRFVATSDGYYTIRAEHSGKCLDVYGRDTSDGVRVVQWTCNGAANQEWRLDQKDNGYFTVVARHSGKCLDVYGRDTANEARIVQWSCGKGWPNQEWRLA